MIQCFRIQNYKALRDVSLELTPMHVLIGPNDSGKTSVLESIAAFCRSVDYSLATAFEGAWTGLDLVWQRRPDALVALDVRVTDTQGGFDYGFACRFKSSGRSATVEQEAAKGLNTTKSIPSPGLNLTVVQLVAAGDGKLMAREDAQRIHDAVGGVHYYRWNPRFLSLPVAPDSSRKFRMEQSGFGLARCLDDVLGYDRRAFDRLEARFVGIFGQFRSIKLLPEMAYRLPGNDESPVPMLNRAEGKGIHFELAQGDGLIPAAQVSDGVLLVLAYLTILHLPEPPRVLLVEEPENGIHPKRLTDVLNILRDLISNQSRTQVVLTTHSPYVLDLFQPDEVSLCQKQADGSVAVRRLSESEVVGRLSDVFSLGEIWTSEGDAALVAAAENGKSGAE